MYNKFTISTTGRIKSRFIILDAKVLHSYGLQHNYTLHLKLYFTSKTPISLSFHTSSTLAFLLFCYQDKTFPLSGLCIISSHFLEGPSLYPHVNNTFLSLKRAFSDHLLSSISLYYFIYYFLLSDIALFIFSLNFYTSL